MNQKRIVGHSFVCAGLLLPSAVSAHEPDVMDTVVITGRSDSLIKIADTASEGYVGKDHIEFRPLQRPGEVLETVPGLIATQHSGDGKATAALIIGIIGFVLGVIGFISMSSRHFGR